MNKEIRFRPLNSSDGPELLKLNQACPIQADFSFYFERAPDFFRWPREVFDEFHYIGAFDADKLAGYALLGFYEGWIGNGWGKVFYLGDARVLPAYRGKRIVQRIFRIFEATFSEQARLGFFAIKKGNVIAQRLAETARPKNYFIRQLCDINVFNVFLLGRRRLVKSPYVQRAQQTDLSNIRDFLLENYQGRLFAPKITPQGIKSSGLVGGQLALGDHYLYKQSGRIRAVLGLWDMTALHRTVVLDYPFAAKLLRLSYPLLQLFWPGTTPLPSLGESFRTFTVTHLAVEGNDLKIFRDLLNTVIADQVGKGYHMIHFGFSENDQLQQGLTGLFHQKFTSELYQLNPLSYPETPMLPPYVDLPIL